jgi:hypothetical protein
MLLVLALVRSLRAGTDDLHFLVNQPTYTHDLTIPSFKQQRYELIDSPVCAVSPSLYSTGGWSWGLIIPRFMVCVQNG